MNTILVVEDDERLNQLICKKLKQEALNTYSANDGIQALELLEHVHIDLIICDIMMPNLNGYELVESIRDARSNLPFLMITAKNQMEDMEKAYKYGTDDYMVKPIRMRELILRVNSLLKRAQIAKEKKLVIRDMKLDYSSLTVTIKDEIFEMPPKEFYLLFKLLSNPNSIFTRLQLLDEIWGLDIQVDDRTIDSHIKKLRRKFEDYNVFEIITIRGLGYKAKY